MKPIGVRVLRLCTVLLLAVVLNHSAPGAVLDNQQRQTAPPGWTAVEFYETNLSPRFVTNVIEVRMPQNVFVTEYRTNWFTRTFTNTVAVNLFETNWITRTVTNHTTFTLTNWATVVVTKTNWIQQPVTNVIALNVPMKSPIAVREDPVILPAEASADVMVMEATKTARPTRDNQVEVKFRVLLLSDPGAALQVQQWRVEREDGGALVFAQGQEFNRSLPTGRYRIHVKARRNAGSPPMALQTTVEVTPDAVALR